MNFFQPSFLIKMKKNTFTKSVIIRHVPKVLLNYPNNCIMSDIAIDIGATD